MPMRGLDCSLWIGDTCGTLTLSGVDRSVLSRAHRFRASLARLPWVTSAVSEWTTFESYPKLMIRLFLISSASSSFGHKVPSFIQVFSRCPRRPCTKTMLDSEVTHLEHKLIMGRRHTQPQADWQCARSKCHILTCFESRISRPCEETMRQ